jgi:predicted ATPase
MIKINKIEPLVVEHFNPNGESLGFLNEFEHNDLKIQIVEHDVEGYYLIFNDVKITINKDGNCSSFPYGLYDVTQRQFALLYRARKNKTNI